MRTAFGKQEVDIFCPVRVSGWIKNIQPIAVAGTHIVTGKIAIFHFSWTAVIV